MNIQITTWGSIQPVYAHSGKIIGEIVSFHSNGIPHTQPDDWELCTVLKGRGKIVIDYKGIGEPPDIKTETEVESGSFLAIQPNILHWMEPDFSKAKALVIFIAYTNNYIR